MQTDLRIFGLNGWFWIGAVLFIAAAASRCQFGVMFFLDKIQGYREARRVLKSGGHSVRDRIRQNEFAHVVTELLARSIHESTVVFEN